MCMITLCKVVQMRETVSTALHSTLLLYLDKVMLETACVRVRVCVRVSVDARWRVARGARACIWYARSLFPTRVREPESVLAGSSACLLARVERMEELMDKNREGGWGRCGYAYVLVAWQFLLLLVAICISITFLNLQKKLFLSPCPVIRRFFHSWSAPSSRCVPRP